ncbi:hypothetical protein WJ70_03375 [Burkholderia ubonensis]|nr:hypothetical protein WJ70_03375 [Burkholderia ubonensis]
MTARTYRRTWSGDRLRVTANARKSVAATGTSVTLHRSTGDSDHLEVTMQPGLRIILEAALRQAQHIFRRCQVSSNAPGDVRQQAGRVGRTPGCALRG